MEKTKQMSWETYKYILNESSPYKILGVEANATSEDINIKYKSFAKEFHPDKHVTKPDNEKKEISAIFTKITSAFNTLKDPEERKRFDYESELNKIKEQAEKNKNALKNTFNGVDPRQTMLGGFTLNNAFTDNKIDANELKKNKAELDFQNGNDKLRKGQLDLAIADLQSAIELNGKIAKYHSYLGLAMQQKGWNGYAQAEFKVALSLDPNDKIAKENYQTVNKEDNKQEKKNNDSGILNKVKNLFKKSP